MFSLATLDYLDELAAHNNREWFEANRAHYEHLVREPALAFITAMQPLLASFAPRFQAVARRGGGSLMRVHRDTRFSRHRTPYKTNIGIQFRHEQARDVHAPGFYLHIATDQCFLGVGCWRPEAGDLSSIRTLIAEEPRQWFAACADQSFAAHWRLAGECLKRPPRGYDAGHPAIEDLKRKEFVADAELPFDELISPRLADRVGERFAETVPFMRFLCRALGVPY